MYAALVSLPFIVALQEVRQMMGIPAGATAQKQASTKEFWEQPWPNMNWYGLHSAGQESLVQSNLARHIQAEVDVCLHEGMEYPAAPGYQARLGNLLQSLGLAFDAWPF